MTEQTTTPAPPVVLSQRAPWNSALRNPYRTRYTLVGGRRFIAESERLDDLWTVWEVDEDGRVVKPDTDFVAHAFTLALVRLAVQMRVAGKTEDEIRTAMITTPRPGTGRNHPRHVERRRSWNR